MWPNVPCCSVRPQKRQKKAAATTSDAATSGAQEAESRPKRAAAPTDLAELKQEPGRAPRQPRAGPGRGHVYEAARPLLEQLGEPPSEELLKQMAGSNWLQRAQLQKQWQTAKMAALQAEVERLLVLNATQAATIEGLRVRVSACPKLS